MPCCVCVSLSKWRNASTLKMYDICINGKLVQTDKFNLRYSRTPIEPHCSIGIGNIHYCEIWNWIGHVWTNVPQTFHWLHKSISDRCWCGILFYSQFSAGGHPRIRVRFEQKKCPRQNVLNMQWCIRIWVHTAHCSSSSVSRRTITGPLAHRLGATLSIRNSWLCTYFMRYNNNVDVSHVCCMVYGPFGKMLVFVCVQKMPYGHRASDMPLI